MSPRPSNTTLQRQRSTIFIQLGLIASLVLLIGLFSLHWTTSSADPGAYQPPETEPLIVLPPVQPVAERAPRPPQPLPPEAIDEIELGEEPLLEPWSIEVPTHAYSEPPSWEAPEPPATRDPNEIIDIVEIMPEMIGGLEGLQRRVRYPEFARNVGAEGVVFVQFVVNTDGTVSDLVCLRDPGYGTCEAAQEAIRRTQFIPARQGDRAVRTRMSVPIRFQLR